MNRSHLRALLAGIFVATSLPALPAFAAPAVDQATVDKMIADWPARPKLAALQMSEKYGAPQQATPKQLIWDNAGPYKRIVLKRAETPHDFPKPHMDFLKHTVDYKISADKVNVLTEFDGSATYDRTEGELSAQCDLEGHNILTLNLANDILTGKTSAAKARKDFGQNVADDILGKKPAYVTALQFTPSKGAPDPDAPVMPGSPKRASTGGGEAESLAFLVALDENEVLAAMEADKKKVSSAVMAYAKMLHKEHGKDAVATLELADKLKMTPLETPAVDAFRQKGATELAMLVPLSGDKFGGAFMKTMIKGHTEALAMLDTRIAAATTDAVKKHLTAARGHVAMHLEKAKGIQAPGAAMGQ